MSEEEYTLASMLDAITHPRAKPPKGELAKVTHVWVVTKEWGETPSDAQIEGLAVFASKPSHDALRELGRQHELVLVQDEEGVVMFEERGSPYTSIDATRVELQP